MDFSITRATSDDLPAVANLLHESDDLHRQTLPSLFREVDDDLLIDFPRAYVSDADHAMLVAVGADGALVGVLYMYLRPPSRAPIVRPAVVAEIDALAVAGPFRRLGIGRRLVAAGLRWAKDVGATRTELNVYDFNEPARQFWASVGFHTLSRRLVIDRLAMPSEPGS